MQQFVLWIFVLLSVIMVTTGVAHHHDPVVDPVIAFLKQLKKARKHSGGGVLGNREEESSSENLGIQSSQSPTSTPILFPSGSQSSGSSSNSNSGQKITISLPPSINFTPSPPSSPQDIQRINSGVSTILNGVRSFDLGQILRGAFTFPTNNNVKSVANNVIDTIFGPIGSRGSSSSGGGDAPDVPNRTRN